MNINKEQNRAKLIKLRKRHLIVKQQFYRSFGIQYRLHLHFYLLWKEWIACALKTWRLWINVRDASFFFFPCHRAWNFTEQQRNSDPIRTHWNVRHCLRQARALLCSLRAKPPIWMHLWMHTVVLKGIWFRILIVTNKYSWPNWDQRKSPDNRDIPIIEVRLYS